MVNCKASGHQLIIFLSLSVVLQCNATVIHTNTSYDFHKKTANCIDGEPCNIFCDTDDRVGPGICELSTINCPSDASCDLYCGPYNYACRTAIINCPVSAACNIHCSGSGTNARLICDHLKPIWSTAAQGTLTCAGSGGQMCSNIQFPVPVPNENMILNCDAQQKCEYSNIICPSNADCTINCKHNHACRDITVTWSINGVNTLYCNESYTDPCLNVNPPPPSDVTNEPINTGVLSTLINPFTSVSITGNEKRFFTLYPRLIALFVYISAPDITDLRSLPVLSSDITSVAPSDILRSTTDPLYTETPYNPSHVQTATVVSALESTIINSFIIQNEFSVFILLAMVLLSILSLLMIIFIGYFYLKTKKMKKGEGDMGSDNVIDIYITRSDRQNKLRIICNMDASGDKVVLGNDETKTDGGLRQIGVISVSDYEDEGAEHNEKRISAINLDNEFIVVGDDETVQ